MTGEQAADTAGGDFQGSDRMKQNTAGGRLAQGADIFATALIEGLAQGFR